VTEARTRALAPFGVGGAPGSLPAQARTAPRPSPWTSAGGLAATPAAWSRRWRARKRVAPTGRTQASTSSGPVSPPSESWRWTSASIARPPLVISAASSLSVPDATAPRSWIGPQLPFAGRERASRRPPRSKATTRWPCGPTAAVSVFARPVPEMIDGAPKRPPGPRSETFTTRRAPLARATHASRPEPFAPIARRGTKATSSTATERAVPSDGPSAEPNATDSRTRVPAGLRFVCRSAATDRWANGTTWVVAPGSARSPPKAAAPGASVAPRAPVAAPLPTPSWKRQSATTVPLPLEAASRPLMNVCGEETVAGAVHVAAVAGTAAASEAAAVATAAARAEYGRMPR
jgi:hypothetical protein